MLTHASVFQLQKNIWQPFWVMIGSKMHWVKGPLKGHVVPIRNTPCISIMFSYLYSHLRARLLDDLKFDIIANNNCRGRGSGQGFLNFISK